MIVDEASGGIELKIEIRMRDQVFVGVDELLQVLLHLRACFGKFFLEFLVVQEYYVGFVVAFGRTAAQTSRSLTMKRNGR